MLPKSAYCFSAADYVLLDNNRLTKYLDAAKWVKTINDTLGRSFIELFFERTPESQSIAANPPAYPLTGPRFSFQNYPSLEEALVNANDGERAVILAYDLLQSATQKELALQYAEKGKNYLDNQKIFLGENPAITLFEIERRLIGYNIIAMVYAWNDKMEKAGETDDLYLHDELIWRKLEQNIQGYLEMLMIKKQRDYLEFLFCDSEFRKFFLAHFEAFVSLFIDDTHILTKQGEVVNILNRVNNDTAYR